VGRNSNNHKPAKSRNGIPRTARVPALASGLLAALMAIFFVLPFAGLVWRLFTLGGRLQPGDTSVFSAASLSLGTTAAAVILIFILGTPLAYMLARYQFPFKQILTVIIELPIVMPPVVAGLALLSAFGRNGLLGPVLARFDITLPFTLAAVVLAQLFVSAPFYIRAAQSQFESLPREFEDAASVDGADRWKTFWLVIFPQSLPALLNGLIISWARALGEFGATILFAGNLEGRTQTMPLLVYSALERDLGVTFLTSIILLGLAILAFTLSRWLASNRIDLQ